MSEAAFTKGPWVVPLDYGRILGAHGEPLFYIEDYGNAERLAADVALIAAAPSLYEALEALVNAEGDLHAGLMEGSVLINARAALALARGER